MRRVAVEEKLLEKTYGEEFWIYAREVSAIVPYLDPKSKVGQEVESAIELLKASI